MICVQSVPRAEVATINDKPLTVLRFHPDTVKLGVVVCWYNVGSHNHTVTGGPWGDSGVIERAEEFMWTADQVGTFGYRCNFHNPLMQSIVKVVP